MLGCGGILENNKIENKKFFSRYFIVILPAI